MPQGKCTRTSLSLFSSTKFFSLPRSPAHPTRVSSAQEPPSLQERQPLTVATAGEWQKGLQSLVRDHTVRELKDFLYQP